MMVTRLMEHQIRQKQQQNFFIFKQKIYIINTCMSLSTSKSKTQLAYTSKSINLSFQGSSKAINKPKNINTTQNQTNDLTKSKNLSKNSTNNIYDSIMGQIDSTQQDYIKNLIVKNERETIKNQREAKKLLTNSVNDQKKTNSVNDQKKTNSVNDQKKTNTVSKVAKQQEVSKKKVTSIPSHERTRSQAEIKLKESLGNVQTEKSMNTQTSKQVTEISCVSVEQQGENNSQQMKIASNPKKQTSKKQQSSSTTYAAFSTNFQTTGKSDKQATGKTDKQATGKSDKITPSSNPIIQALNNSSSSFAKKINVFELQYPSEERYQRSTHKKVGSKLPGEYFSCQTSPKNGAKNQHRKEVVLTTKPSITSYNSTKNNQHQTAMISPIYSVKNSNQKNYQRHHNESQQIIPTNFLSSLDEYLEALTVNTSENQSECWQNNRPGNGSMKRNDLNKIREFSTVRSQFQQPFILAQEDQDQETILLQNGTYYRSSNHKVDNGKLLTFSQQQKLLASLEKQRKKVSELKSIIELFNQQLTKYKKKEKKMKQNAYHMMGCLKQLNQELTEEKRQRRKLEEVVKQFESKIRGISRGKDNKRRESVEEEQRVERKTTYGASFGGNNIQYSQPVSNFYQSAEIMERDTPKNIEKHSKKHSGNRLSSVITSIAQQYSRDIMNEKEEYENFYPKKRSVIEEGSRKNRTQKASKIISTFALETQPFDDEDIKNYRQGIMKNQINNAHLPNSCKNSYLNSSVQSPKNNKSRPMTPKLISEIFKANKQQRNQQSQPYIHEVSNIYDSGSETEELSPEYNKQQYKDDERDDDSISQSQSDFNPTQNIDDSSEFEERNSRAYHTQQNDRFIRMR